MRIKPFLFALPALALILSCSLVTVLPPEAPVLPTIGPGTDESSMLDSTSTAQVLPATLSPSSLVTRTLVPALSSQAGLRRAYRQMTRTPDWPPVGLSAERQQAWERFATGEADLSSEQILILQAFVDRWELFHRLVDQRVPMESNAPQWSVVEVPEAGSGDSKPVLAAIGDQGRYFVVAYDRQNRPQRLLLAPTLPELTQRISADGQFVEYLNAKGEVLLILDGRLFTNGDVLDELMIELMDEHQADPAYRSAKVLPRFRINLPGIPTSFYLLENLTYNQILLLISTLQVYDRPEFSELKQYLFLPDDQAPYLITRQPHPVAAAMAYRLGGNPRRGVMLIFTRNVFRNKYETAGSLAHEAAHIWQGRGHGCDQPQLRLRDEVGQGKVAVDFYNWTPDQLFSAVENGEIGAYHLSLWVALRFNLADYARFYREIIINGSASDLQLINCQK